MRKIYALHCLRFTTYLSGLSLNRALWFVAKFIQAIGLFEVIYGLIIGLKDDNLGLEFRYAGIGVVIFVVGWLIEKKLGGR